MQKNKCTVIVIALIFLGTALLPCVSSKDIVFKAENNYEISCKIFSDSGVSEVKKNISLMDFQILNQLHNTRFTAFIEKAGKLGLYGNVSSSEVSKIIGLNKDRKTDILTAYDIKENRQCFFSFSGTLFKIYYLPIPYFVTNPIVWVPFALLFLGLVYYYTTHNMPIINALLNQLVKIIEKHQDLFNLIIKLGQKTISAIGSIQSWTPIKFPIRSTVIATGNFKIETNGTEGTWNNTATVTMILMGFRGLWFSLPPASIPPYCPTWCIGHAKLLMTLE
jgi:hypothetical protein